jgi:hypothetical protein
MVLADWSGSSRTRVTTPVSSAAHAQGGEAVPLVLALQFVDEGAEDHRAGGAERVTEGDRAAVDVDLVQGQSHVPDEAQDDRRERLVDLDQVDVVDGQPGLGERLAGGGGGSGEHDGGLGTGNGGGDDPRARGEPVAVADLLGADGDEGGAVHDAGGVARVVDVVDLLHPVVLLQRHGVEAAEFADVGEGGLELREGVGGGAGPQVLVVVEDGEAGAVLHRHDGPLEAALLPRRGRPLLGEGRVLVDVAAGEALDGGDQVGADALRDEVGGEVGHRVVEPGAAVRGHRHPGHGLDAPREDQVLPAGTDLHGRHVDGLQTRGTEAVLLDAGHRVGESGGDGGDAGDVGALVADRSDDAEDDVVDGGRVEVGEPGADLVDEADDQVDGLRAVQGSVRLAASARGADRVVHVRFGGHWQAFH